MAVRAALGRLILVASTPTSKRFSIRGSLAVQRVGFILLGVFVAMCLAIIT
jgi:hypothetical protein